MKNLLLVTAVVLLYVSQAESVTAAERQQLYKRTAEGTCKEHSKQQKVTECNTCALGVFAKITKDAPNESGQKLRDRVSQAVAANCAQYFKEEKSVKACGSQRSGAVDCLKKVFKAPPNTKLPFEEDN